MLSPAPEIGGLMIPAVGAGRVNPSEEEGRERVSAMERRLPFMLYRAAQVAQQMGDDGLAALDLSSRQFGVLTLLVERGPLSQQELAGSLRIDRTTMVTLIDELERRGYVQRHRDPEDRRRYALRLTPAGGAIQQRAAAVLATCEADYLEPLSATDRAQLFALLSRLEREP